MISGSVLLSAFVTLVVVGIICWLCWWFISYIGLPAPFNKVARVLIALVAVIFLINFLLGLTGTPLIRW
jgi:hypothetical protein